MSTRGLVLRLVGDSWAGFEIQADAYPAWAGAELIRLLAEHGLDEVCRRTVAGRLFSNMHELATPSTHASRGDLLWAYVLDPARRELRIYHEGAVATADAPALLGTWACVGRHAIQADGSCTPPAIHVELPAPWPLLRVEDSWSTAEGLPMGAEDERRSDAEATARLANRRRVLRDCAAASLEVGELYRRLEQLVVERFLRAPWGHAPRRVYLERSWTSGSKYWRLELDGTSLLYPPPGGGREVARSSTGAELLTLFVEPDREHELDVRHEPLVEDPVVRAILRTAIHGVPWVFSMLDLVRARQRPDPRGEALERLSVAPREATDWQVFVHPDGRTWSIRPSAKGYQLRIGEPSDPVFKERRGGAAELQQLIQEQLAEGFAPRR